MYLKLAEDLEGFLGRLRDTADTATSCSFACICSTCGSASSKPGHRSSVFPGVLLPLPMLG